MNISSVLVVLCLIASLRWAQQIFFSACKASCLWLMSADIIKLPEDWLIFSIALSPRGCDVFYCSLATWMTKDSPTIRGSDWWFISKTVKTEQAGATEILQDIKLTDIGSETRHQNVFPCYKVWCCSEAWMFQGYYWLKFDNYASLDFN
jgi:hypothetical protein